MISNIKSQLQHYYPPCGSEPILVELIFLSNIGAGIVNNFKYISILGFKNISMELSSVKLELQKIKDYANGTFPSYLNEKEIEPTWGIDLSSCQEILKKKYGLPKEEDLLIIKADIPFQFNLTEFFLTETYYQIFSYSLGAILPLSVCKEEGVFVEITKPLISSALTQPSNLLKSKTISVLTNGYDVFDTNSPFYNDICTPYTNENGNDVLLDLRRKDYYNENMSLCNNGCKLVGYNIKSMVYTFRCNIRTTPDESAEVYKGIIPERFLHKNFKNLSNNRTNIALLKCASNVFSFKGQTKNFGSYILIINFASFVGILLFHFFKEKSSMNNELIILTDPQRNKGENYTKKERKDKRSKITSKEKETYDEIIGVNSSLKRFENFENNLTYMDYEINFSSFNDALKENNSYLLIYWNFLKFKQIIIFTFFSSNRGILRSTKIVLFILFFAFNMAFTVFFYNDNIIRALYISKGNINFSIHLPNIISSSFCSYIAYLIIRHVFQNKSDISTIINERNNEQRKAFAKQAKRKASIKLYILYTISAVLIFLCWYYVSAFCAIFKNSQKSYLINFFLCFIISNLWTFFICIILTIMLKKALDYKIECLYKASKMLSIF